MSLQSDVRTAPGWLSVRHPLTAFLGQRASAPGTGPSTLIGSMVRAAPGWLSARPSTNFRPIGRPLGTAASWATPKDVRTAPVWLSVRRLVISMARRGSILGTGRIAPVESMSCVAPGWLSARPSRQVSLGRTALPGTARGGDKQMVSCAAPGWLSAQEPIDFSENSAADGGGYHLPVFPAEVADWMAAGPEKFIIDGTLGGGGHSEMFLQAGARVLGVDRDPEALAHARERLARFGDRFSTWEGNFADVQQSPLLRDGQRADGWLLDLGVSSRQLDSAARGFSFMREGPLDMRMGPSSPRTAADIVNGWPEAEIVRILFEFGEESSARRIAAAIVGRRATRPFTTTLDLAEFIEKTTGRHGRTHPATKTFQAIRMAVNEELESLATALAAAPAVLNPGGRLLVITFHSLEDRLVKRSLRHRSTPFLDERGWPEPRPNPEYQFRLLARKAIAPTTAETSRNPRARSAKLRVAQLLPPTP